MPSFNPIFAWEVQLFKPCFFDVGRLSLLNSRIAVYSKKSWHQFKLFHSDITRASQQTNISYAIDKKQKLAIYFKAYFAFIDLKTRVL